MLSTGYTGSLWVVKVKKFKIHCATYLDEETHAKLKEVAEQYNLTISDVLRMAITQFLRKYEEELRMLRKARGGDRVERMAEKVLGEM